VRALFVSNLLPPHALGGYESVCADVAERWRRAGHEVTVLTSVLRRPGIDTRDGIGTRRELPMSHLHAPVAPWWRRPAVERRARDVVDRAVGQLRPEVALVWNMAGLPFGAVRRLEEQDVPLLFVVGDTWPGSVASSDPWIAPFRGGAPRRALGALAALLTGAPTDAPAWQRLGVWAFSSESLRRQVAEATGEDFTESLVVPHGIDPIDFPITRDPPVSSWRWRVLFVGRLDPTKGIDTLVRAMPLLPPDAVLEVCAPVEPVHLARVEGLVGSLGLRDRVTIQSVERRQLRERYRAADVCVFPSEWEEPFGLVPLESMACGTPVVASGTGGSGEYLQAERNCLLATPGRPEAIVDAVERLAADRALRERVVDGGRHTAASLTVDALADGLADLALDLTGHR
jgi:glycosyltransferase involved in cell wall biosynthesis